MPDNSTLVSDKTFFTTFNCIKLIIATDFFYAVIIDYKVMNDVEKTIFLKDSITLLFKKIQLFFTSFFNFFV